MLEASMDKHNSIIFRQHDIGTSRIFPIVLSEAQPSREQITANNDFRIGVLALDPLHYITACLFAEFICHVNQPNIAQT